jgi:hypothetical protein
LRFVADELSADAEIDAHIGKLGAVVPHILDEGLYTGCLKREFVELLLGLDIGQRYSIAEECHERAHGRDASPAIRSMAAITGRWPPRTAR